jgi:hypothetical protein
MAKRITLWNTKRTQRQEDTGGTPKQASSALKARLSTTQPQKPRKVDPPPAEPVAQTPKTLEAGQWEKSPDDRPSPVAPPREAIKNRGYGKRARRVPRNKTRRHTISVAVSDEEERILRSYAAALDISFSEWARSVMFKAMDKNVPPRRNKPE